MPDRLPEPPEGVEPVRDGAEERPASVESVSPESPQGTGRVKAPAARDDEGAPGPAPVDEGVLEVEGRDEVGAEEGDPVEPGVRGAEEEAVVGRPGSE